MRIYFWFWILKSLNDLSTFTSIYKVDLFMQGMNFYITGVDNIKKYWLQQLNGALSGTRTHVGRLGGNSFIQLSYERIIKWL